MPDPSGESVAIEPMTHVKQNAENTMQNKRKNQSVRPVEWWDGEQKNR